MFVLRHITFVFLITASTAIAAQDATPSTMVAYFTSQGCPAGWTIAAPARGRLIVAANTAATNGIQVGNPLSPATPPRHSHRYTATFNLPRLGIAAGDCCNGTGAKAGSYTHSSWSNTSNGELPYVQLTVCQKQ
jgi:hypothetical protein